MGPSLGLSWCTACLQRDVPGMTRNAIPILTDEGVQAITIGVNGGSAPPGVPKNTPFIWRDSPPARKLSLQCTQASLTTAVTLNSGIPKGLDYAEMAAEVSHPLIVQPRSYHTPSRCAT